MVRFIVHATESRNELAPAADQSSLQQLNQPRKRCCTVTLLTSLTVLLKARLLSLLCLFSSLCFIEPGDCQLELRFIQNQ